LRLDVTGIDRLIIRALLIPSLDRLPVEALVEYGMITTNFDHVPGHLQAVTLINTSLMWPEEGKTGGFRGR
jgi:hypothetical protein